MCIICVQSHFILFRKLSILRNLKATTTTRLYFCGLVQEESMSYFYEIEII
jgi:hypothetical protein